MLSWFVGLGMNESSAAEAAGASKVVAEAIEIVDIKEKNKIECMKYVFYLLHFTICHISPPPFTIISI
jgi:hypothetical protein